MIYCITLIAAVLTAYLIGSIPFGFIIGQCHGLDIRKEGSGNIGATNVTRVIGPWWGKLCFLLDFLKGFVPVGIAAPVSGAVGAREDVNHDRFSREEGTGTEIVRL